MQQARIDQARDLGAHGIDITCRIDDRDPLGLAGGDGEEALADATVEVEVEFDLEPGDVARRLAGEPRLDRDVEEDREIGSQPVGGEVVEATQDVDLQTGAVALVGERRDR